MLPGSLNSAGLREGARLSIKAEHEYSVIDRKGFIEQHDSNYISITIHDVQLDEQGSVGDVVKRYCRQR